MLTSDTIVHSVDGIIYHTYPQRHCSYTLFKENIMYNIKCSYIPKPDSPMLDAHAQHYFTEGFTYIIENHIDPAKGNEINQLRDLFQKNNYPLNEFWYEPYSDFMFEVYIDVGDCNDFLAFIERLKQEYSQPIMPTKTELLQFLNKGDD